MKAGGMASLEAGLAAGRIIRANHNGMQVFMFPRCEFSREKLFRQKLHGAKSKMLEDKGQIESLADENMGMEWEAANFITGALGDFTKTLPQPLTSSAAQVASSTSPMASGGSSAFPLSDLMTSSQPTMAPFASPAGSNPKPT